MINPLCYRIVFGGVLVLLSLLAVSRGVFATATVTPATGGSAISADTTGGTYTSLIGPIVSEGATGDIGTGTIILNVPSGFIFDTDGTAPTVLVNRISGAGSNVLNINDLANGSTISVTRTTTQLIITISDNTGGSVTNSLTWQNVRVRPSAVTPLASGNIVKTGTSVITGVTNSVTNLGTLTEVIGATPTPTSTPGEDPANVQTTTGGGGGNDPAKIIFSGKAFPGATLGVYLMGEEYGQVLINGEFKTEGDGSFEKEITSPVQEQRFYGLLIKDKNGSPTKSKFFTYNLKFNTIVRQENIIFAPTIKINKSAFTRNEILLVLGDAAPGNTVEVLANGKVVGKNEVGRGGLYQILINTSELTLGSYKIQARQIDSGSSKVSDVSETKIVRVGAFSFAHIDFNQDSQINISDWSIFLSNWSSADKNIHLRDDLNGDGDLDISDFSVFLTSFQLSNR